MSGDLEKPLESDASGCGFQGERRCSRRFGLIHLVLMKWSICKAPRECVNISSARGNELRGSFGFGPKDREPTPHAQRVTRSQLDAWQPDRLMYSKHQAKQQHLSKPRLPSSAFDFLLFHWPLLPSETGGNLAAGER